MTEICLRLATEPDIDFILIQEYREDFRNYIGRFTRPEHLFNLKDPDQSYLMVEQNSRKPLGYIILNDLTSEHHGILLKRIVIAEPNKGYGKKALQQLMKKVFEEYNAHRFWLDVFVKNQRARSVYRSLGFREEGILRDTIKQENTYRSLVVMSLLQPEYQALN
ncbi:MAG: GNAT family N-acetyltransferase [Oscillatoriales cyanobacterium RM2_1_1]|nr:GNAT family N-acetyltransferase [Oscillatoriales cyanobacterium RM2_1_1]